MLPTRFNTTIAMLLTAITFAVWPVPTSAFEPQAEKKSETKVKWEYKVVTAADIEKLAPRGSQDKLTDGLNALGEQGWEMVAVTPHVPDLGALGGPGMPAAGRIPMPPGGPGGAGMILNVKPATWVFKRAR
jgi:hypothetical protein